MHPLQTWIRYARFQGRINLGEDERAVPLNKAVEVVAVAVAVLADDAGFVLSLKL